MRAFLAIADLWGLDEEQRLLILGCPARSTFYKWAKIAREHGEMTLDVDTLTRISAVLGIHQALGILHPSEKEGAAWLKTPHGATVFGGRPPLALVTSGTQDGLMTVRRFLDAARGGIYMEPVEALDRNFVQRLGFKRAAVAVARKIGVVLHAMWKSNQPFEAWHGATPKARAA